MSSLKKRLPSLEALQSNLDSVLDSNLADFLAATGDTREKVKANFLFAVTAVSFIVAIFGFLFLSEVIFADSWLNRIMVMFAMLWTVVFLVSGRSWFVNSRLLARQMNMALVPIFTSVFDRPFMYTNNHSNTEVIKKLLSESALITGSNISVISDDSYYGYGDTSIEFHELLVNEKRRNYNSKTTQYIQIFKGLLVVAELPKTHSAETFISTDGDRAGFAHKGFWSNLLNTAKVKETVLEWNDFEDKLHVASTDATAAREVLTPDFMANLYDWWNEHKLNMRIAFKGNKLYLLMPEETIHITSSTTSVKKSVIKIYAESLIRPMWRSLMLVEDVPR